MFNIRPLTADDIPAVLRIYQCGVDSKATFETTVPTPEEWDKKYLRDCRLVAVCDNNIVGYAVLAPTSTRHVYRGVAELSCYIAPTHTRQGIGNALTRRIIALAEQQGIWTIEAKIIEGNIASIKMLEKCGFRHVGIREKLGYDRDGVWKDIVLMERRSQP
jgi:phosphinothricin acetyltransferase